MRQELAKERIINMVKIPDILSKVDWQKYAPFIALILLIIVSSFLSPYFLKIQNLMNIVRQVSYAGIIALGMTFVIIGGGIDLSVGSIIAFVGAVVVLSMNALLKVIDSEVIVLVFGIIIGVSVGGIAGAFNGFIIAKGKIAPFIATLGSMAIFRSLTLYIGNAGEISSQNRLFGDFGMGSFLFIPAPVWIMIILTIILGFVLSSTRYGRYIYAIGANQKVARFSAINVNFVSFLSYALIGMLIGISAILLASRFNAVSTSGMGLGLELDVIAAVIVGGTSLMGGSGTIWGTFCGVIILGIINNMLNMVGVSPYLNVTVKFILIIAAVYIKRQKH